MHKIQNKYMKQVKEKNDSYTKLMAEIRLLPLRLRVNIAFRMINGMGIIYYLKQGLGYKLYKKARTIAGNMRHGAKVKAVK